MNDENVLHTVFTTDRELDQTYLVCFARCHVNKPPLIQLYEVNQGRLSHVLSFISRSCAIEYLQ